LGIPVGTAPPVTETWSKIIDDTEKILNLWSRWNLSITGRILIVKTLALSKLVYISFALNSPKECLSRLTNLIWKFIWKGRKDRVSRKTTSLPKSVGGLDCFDIEAYLASFRLKILQRMISTPDPHWTSYWKGRLTKSSGSWNLSLPCLILSEIPSSHLNLPPFWKEALKDLQNLRPKFPNFDFDNLFLNPAIQVSKRSLFQRKWKEIHLKGLVRISQIWNGTRFKSIQEIRRDTGVRIASKTLLLLTSAIPQALLVPNPIQQQPSPPISSLMILIGDSWQPFIGKSCSALRIASTLSTPLPKDGIPYWSSRWDPDFDWKKTWKNLHLQQISRHRETHWLLLHKKLALSELFLRWRPDSEFNCPHCPGESASHIHVFYNCPLMLPLWFTVLNLLHNQFPECPVFPLEHQVISGIFSPDLPLKSPLMKLWRILHGTTIHTIWTLFCSSKFGNQTLAPLEIHNNLMKNLRTNLISTSSKLSFLNE
jgi:hypothetical protein